MTLGRASALAAGLLVATALGIWIAPQVTSWRTAEPVAADAPLDPAAQPSAPAEKPASSKAAATSRTSTPPVISLSPELHKRLKPVLNRGADMSVASDGFRSAEQFATVAHAAQNTGAPFMLLKHRVLEEGKPLATAIGMSRPDLDGAAEASRAKAEAKADLASADSEIATVGGE